MKRTALLSDTVSAFLFSFLVVTVLLLTGQVLSAQKISPSPQDLYTEANEYMLSGDYQEALALLLSLDGKGYRGSNVSYRIGICYLNGRGQKTRAIPFLKNAVENVKKVYSDSILNAEGAPPKSLLYLGIAYRLNNELDKAIECFHAYEKSLDQADTSGKELVQFHIDRCENARQLMASPSHFTVDTLPALINAAHAHFNPVVTADERQLYFMEQLKFYDAVMFTLKKDSSWIEPENLTPAIHSDGDHVVTGVSGDGNYLLLSLNDVYQNGEIFAIERKNTEWKELEKLNSNINTRFNETHASLSPDGKTLYFTSDRQGGFGGLDIYRSDKNAQGSWGPAVNLGPLINTPLNEETPFVTPDGKTLFFSSQGHYNMGGYDIFMSTSADGEWMAPLNLGYPINTTDDDLFFFPLASNQAYQSRFPVNGGQSELVKLKIMSIGNPDRFTIKGKMHVTGAEPGEVTLIIENTSTHDVLGAHMLSKDGSFEDILAAGTYNLNFAVENKTLLKKDIYIPANFPQETLIINADLDMDQPETTVDTVFLQDIRFAFNQSRAAESADYLENLVLLLRKYPSVRLTLHGFTDAIGDYTYNVKLSLARANAVAGILEAAGIDAGRITVQEHGETDPVAMNKTAGGEDCPEGRAFNRRVEIVLTDIPAHMIVNRQTSIPLNLRVKK